MHARMSLFAQHPFGLTTFHRSYSLLSSYAFAGIYYLPPASKPKEVMWDLSRQNPEAQIAKLGIVFLPFYGAQPEVSTRFKATFTKVAMQDGFENEEPVRSECSYQDDLPWRHYPINNLMTYAGGLSCPSEFALKESIKNASYLPHRLQPYSPLSFNQWTRVNPFIMGCYEAKHLIQDRIERSERANVKEAVRYGFTSAGTEIINVEIQSIRIKTRYSTPVPILLPAYYYQGQEERLMPALEKDPPELHYPTLSESMIESVTDHLELHKNKVKQSLTLFWQKSKTLLTHPLDKQNRQAKQKALEESVGLIKDYERFTATHHHSFFSPPVLPPQLCWRLKLNPGQNSRREIEEGLLRAIREVHPSYNKWY